MDMKRFFLYFMVIAALALAGCGGNGGTTTVQPPEPPPSCPDGQTGTPPNCVTPGPSVADLFETAQNARDAAEAAETDAEAAVKAATEASGKLDVLSVAGNSMMAQENAQSVLDNQTKANDAVTAAEKAETDLMQADKDADEHNNSALDNAIADAIKVAEDAVETAKEQAEGKTLKMAVEKVTGDDPKAKDYPMTPAQIGTGVADQIEAALKATSSTDGSATRLTDLDALTTAPTTATDPKETRVLMDDHQGMTWEMIVGSDKVMDFRIVDGVTTSKVRGSSVATMTAADVDADLTSTGGTNSTNEYADGFQTDNSTYNGIPGTTFCNGSDCSVDTDGKLKGGWYFTPSDDKEYYVRNAADTMYEVETLYARFGHWLSVATNLTTVNLYAAPGNSATNATGLEFDGDPLTDTEATYKGSAVGMSVRKQFNADGTVVSGSTQSGAFTADVTLDATFGASPTLMGTINNFQSNNSGAVDSSWSIKLLPAAYTGTITSPNGVTSASGQNGEWSAASYGVSGQRPTGIYGGFNAHFTNGNAAGAYATRKQ